LPALSPRVALTLGSFVASLSFEVAAFAPLLWFAMSDGSTVALIAALAVQPAAFAIFHNRFTSARWYYSWAPLSASLIPIFVVLLLYLEFPITSSIWAAVFVAVRLLLLAPPKLPFTGIKWPQASAGALK
jgi:hypothetical protein